MAGIRTCDRESQVHRPNHYTTEPPRGDYWSGKPENVGEFDRCRGNVLALN